MPRIVIPPLSVCARSIGLIGSSGKWLLKASGICWFGHRSIWKGYDGRWGHGIESLKKVRWWQIELRRTCLFWKGGACAS